MNEAQQAADLAAAIMQRAQGFAADYQNQAQQAVAKIRGDAKQRLERLEAREQDAAKSAAERSYKRLVQAGELRLQAELDRLRWTVMNSVLQHVRVALQQQVADTDTYLPLLKTLITQAAADIEQDQLIAEVNSRDHALLVADWQEASAGKQIALFCNRQANWLGGSIVYSADRRIRIDNTLDGRLQQRHNVLCQVILKTLFPTDAALRRLTT